MSSDRGISSGRTALSGQRTALSVAAGSAIIARQSFDRLGSWALVVLLVNLPLSAWVLIGSRVRYARRVDGARRPGASALAALCLAVVVLALVELLALTRLL